MIVKIDLRRHDYVLCYKGLLLEFGLLYIVQYTIWIDTVYTRPIREFIQIDFHFNEYRQDTPLCSVLMLKKMQVGQ